MLTPMQTQLAMEPKVEPSSLVSPSDYRCIECHRHMSDLLTGSPTAFFLVTLNRKSDFRGDIECAGFLVDGSTGGQTSTLLS